MDYKHRPSGKKLPFFFSTKWRKGTQAADREKNLKWMAGPLADKVFSISEIEDGLRRTADALSAMQKQICRGEELYYEETMPHRNICKGGLEGFVDSKDSVAGDNGFTRSLHQSVRKVPADVRWFSESRVSPEQVVKENLDNVLSASARKPKMELPVGSMPSAEPETSSAVTTLHENKLVEPQSIGWKRKRNDAVDCSDTTPPNRREIGEGLKGAQGSPTTRIDEGNARVEGESESHPAKDNASGGANNLPVSRDSTAVSNKDGSKKVDPQRRRRSRRSINS